MSPIGIHQFSGKVLDKNVCFQALKLTDQLLLWIGLESDPSFKDFAVAMSTPYEKITHHCQDHWRPVFSYVFNTC